MTKSLEAQLEYITAIVRMWVEKQGHDRCWYYPEIFRELADELGINYPHPGLPSREEFERGCTRYQKELYLDGKERPLKITIERRPSES
jgi:hypothetical protein